MGRRGQLLIQVIHIKCGPLPLGGASVRLATELMKLLVGRDSERRTPRTCQLLPVVIGAASGYCALNFCLEGSHVSVNTYAAKTYSRIERSLSAIRWACADSVARTVLSSWSFLAAFCLDSTAAEFCDCRDSSCESVFENEDTILVSFFLNMVSVWFLNWWTGRELHPQKSPCKGGALLTMLQAQKIKAEVSCH